MLFLKLSAKLATVLYTFLLVLFVYICFAKIEELVEVEPQTFYVGIAVTTFLLVVILLLQFYGVYYERRVLLVPAIVLIVHLVIFVERNISLSDLLDAYNPLGGGRHHNVHYSTFRR